MPPTAVRSQGKLSSLPAKFNSAYPLIFLKTGLSDVPGAMPLSKRLEVSNDKLNGLDKEKPLILTLMAFNQISKGEVSFWSI